MDEKSGHFLPLILKSNSFTHFTADDIDSRDATLDDKETLQATQIGYWQSGSGNIIERQHIK